jgi:cell division protein FtsZ
LEDPLMVGAPQNYLAVIKVVGVGGGGVNAVNRMIDAGLKGVEFIAVNTDAQALLMSDADVKLDVGRDLTRGLGAPAVTQRSVGAAAEGAPRRDRRNGEVAPTWCSSPPARAAAPAPARHLSSPRSLARPGALTIGVVTRPFSFEGRRRAVQADNGVQKSEGEGRPR